MDIHGTVFLKLWIILFKVHLKADYTKFILNRTNWIEAHKACIILGGYLPTEDKISGYNEKIENSKIWTGNHQILSPWLTKAGCLDFEHKKTDKVQNTMSVQDCYRLCDKPFSGYKNKRCFCFARIDASPNFTANSRCIHLNTNGLMTAWVYLKKELKISGVDNLKESGNCVGARCENGNTILKVFPCNSTRNAYCHDGFNTTTPSYWNEAEKWCNKEGTFLVINYPSVCENTKGENASSFWTGYKRYWYTSSDSLKDSIHDLSEVSNCSYTQYRSNGVTALGNQGNCSEELDGYACLIDRVTESISNGSTTKISSQQSFNNISIVSTNKQQHLRTNSFRSTKQSTQTGTDHLTEPTTLDSATSGILTESAKKNSFTVLIVVLTIAAVAFIISVAVLVSCRLRRQGPFKRKGLETDAKMMEMHDPNYHDFNTTSYNAPSILHNDTAYDTHNGTHFGISDPTSIQSGINTQYSVVIKPIPETTESSFDQKEESSFDIKENEYDRLNDIKDCGRNDSDNIYDSNSGLRDEDDHTYNTTSKMHVRSRDGSNNIYDSTSG